MSGCEPTPAPRPATLNTTQPFSIDSAWVRAFREQIQRDGELTFRSWCGKRYGMDDDTDLRFHTDGTAALYERGFAGEIYPGTYQLDSNGKLTAKFEGIDHEWPEMRLGIDDQSLYLTRNDFINVRLTGSRIAATQPNGRTYWPFRLVPKLDH